MYDLIVIGDDLSSHIAAAVASSKGIKTALISENGIANSSVVGDLVFNTDMTPLSGLGENQIFFSLLKDLNISPDINILNPSFQVILPENRLDFFNDKEALVKELAREFPDQAREIKSYYDAIEKNSHVVEKWFYDHPLIQPRKFRDYVDYLKLASCLIKNNLNDRRLKRLISRNPSFHKVIEAHNVLLSFRINHQTSLFSNFQYCAPLRGIYHFPQGKQAFFDALIKKVEMSDGLYLTNHEVISIKKGRFIEVTYHDKSGDASKVEADHLIVSTKWQHMHLVIDRKKKFSFGDFLRPTKISKYPFTIHLGIDPACLPEKMARHVAVISDIHKDIYDDNLIILESMTSQSAQTIAASKIPLSATVFLSDNQDIWSNENLHQVADSMMKRLESFLPFLQENIKFLDVEESIKISQKQRDVVNPKYQIRNALITGFAAKSNKTKFGNIYLTGASLLSDAGFEGEIISGINAANRVEVKRK
jgi:phytoene dehydrogenase-like protein